MGRLLCCVFLIAALLHVTAVGGQPTEGLSALTRLQPDNLDKTRKALEALRAQAKPPDLDDGYDDYRAVIHAHSRLSHDSRGTPEEILAAAKQTRTSVVMMTEHPDPKIDWFAEGLSGMRDGVLFIPGAETDGLLVFPKASLKGRQWSSPQGLVDMVNETGGLSFLSHVEERLDWNLSGLAGMEIYNIHTDFLDEPEMSGYLATALADPKRMAELTAAFTQYYQEAFASLQDHLAQIIRRWDELNSSGRLTGIAANDSHNNVGFVAKAAQNGRVVVEDPIGEKLIELEVAKIPLLAAAARGKKPGDVIFALRIDPYAVSFGYVGTHLLMRELSADSVWDALKNARCFVSFDWMADATGFVFMATDAERKASMGEEITLSPGLRVIAAAPLRGKMRLFRNGELVVEKEAARLEYAPDRPGAYRVEVWLSPAGDLRPWIYSNPIFVR